MKKDNLIFLVVILISLLGVVSLFHPGFFLTDDGNSMVIRFSSFYEGFRSGQLPVRFLTRLNNLYGYPVADFLYPLFMYIGVPIKAFGFSFVNTVKIILALSFISSAIFSFLWLRKLFDKESAFVGSLVYAFFPYHLFDIYKRGSVGEVLSLAISPFILWQIERRNLIWGSIGIFLLILAHNTLAVLFFILIFLYAVLDIYVAKKRETLVSYYTNVFLIGISLSSFFSLPAIFDLRYTIFSSTQVADWSKYFTDFSLIGISTLVIVLITLVFIAIGKIEVKKHRLTLLMLALSLLSVFLASSASYKFWQLLPVSFIQFPFRFLSLTIICTSFLSACIVSILKGENKIIVGIIILILVLLSSKDLLSPKVYQNYPDTFYSTNLDSTTVKNEYMPKWTKAVPVERPLQKAQVIKGNGQIKNLFFNGKIVRFDLTSKNQNLVQINTIYFPGWVLKVDNNEKNILYGNKYGIIQFEAEKGLHKIEAGFEETNFRLFSDLISIISLFILLSLSFRKNVKVF